MLDGLFKNSRLREKALDAAWLRNEAISENIANVDTPGYKRKTVAFEEFLNDAMESGPNGPKVNKPKPPVGGNEIDDSTSPKVVEDNKSLSVRLDGNNIDIENEMAAMAKNTIQYNTLVQSLNGYYRRLKSAINEGRR